MPRRVFFSFHYADIMNANIVRMSGQFKPTKETGFYDASLWEEAKLKGEAAIKRLIDDGLKNTSVTCVLIGESTHARRWCKYEVEQSRALGKGLFGVLLPNQTKYGPKWISQWAPVYTWDHSKFPSWVDQAAEKVGR